ncbi:MAG: GNAT family N-acetyltransferase [Xanthobacteraceae bacterium]|nr:GNAT family N-acetyltransferase [Xanthobacteraceae bacterium]
MTLLEREPTEGLPVARKAVLRTARLTLRAPRPDDAKAIKALINDRRIAENTASIPHPYTLKDARAFIANAAGKPAFVITRDDGRLIGGGGIDLRPRGYEIGYWIGVPYWGNGYATEAARALVDHAFRDLDLTELLAGARVTNPASRRVLEKCGFQWTHVVLQRVVALNSSAPSDRFRLDRGLWASLRSWGKAELID